MHPRLFVALVLIAALAGCGPSNETELRQWMAEVRQTTKPTVEPVSPPRPFKPRQFTDAGLIDPFDLQKVTPPATRQVRTGTGKQPDLARRREVLEAYSLDQMRMVGVMKQGKEYVALVDAAGMTYLVRVGNHMGQNFGSITRISETQIDLVELAQDAAGEWVERPAKLELQESSASQQGGKR
jgi:type IV pilus assembly protein PilP